MTFHSPKNIYSHVLQMKKDFYSHTLEILESAITDFEQLYAEGIEEYSSEHLEDLADEGGLLLSYLRDTAELLLVSEYRWVETSLKILLCWAPDLKKKKVNKFNFDQIKAEFNKRGTDLEAIDSHSSVNLLRNFANSWKHEPSQPSRQLLANLKISKTDNLRGLLSCEPIWNAMHKRLDIDVDDDTGFQLVRAVLTRCTDFLQFACDNSSFSPNHLKS